MNDRELVRYASLAASSHNTQPWKFKIDDGSISILPDFSRRCPVVDPDDHHLFASLGCAAENLLVAAEAAGLHGQPLFDSSRDDGAIALFVWLGVVRGSLRFSTGRSVRHVLAGALVAYALVYPLINLAEGFEFPRMPTFGVPCPTTILTIGLLLTVKPPSWAVAIIPIIWSLIGGSAALLLGVQADLMLFVAGVLFVTSVAMAKRPQVG